MTINPSNNPSEIMLGSAGAVIVTTTALQTGPFYRIKALTAVVIGTAVLEDSITGSLNGVTLIAGDELTLYTITSITLTSGTAVLYKVSSE